MALLGAVAWVTLRQPLAQARGQPDAGGVDASFAHGEIETSQVFVANHGKLVGAMSGFAWVAAADGVQVDSPSPCDERRCFSGANGTLCARARSPEPSWDRASALDDESHRESWALKIGFDVRRGGGPWAAAAKPYVSVDYRGATHVRLAAHRSGDPTREYCVDGYAPGELVTADQFRVECWRRGGDRLASFEDIDKLMIELPSSAAAETIDLCITSIAVADWLDRRDHPH